MNKHRNWMKFLSFGAMLSIGIGIASANGQVSAPKLRHNAPASDYAYQWPIQNRPNDGAARIVLTAEIYAALSSRELNDLAVFDARGTSVPVAIIPSQLFPSARRETLGVELSPAYRVQSPDPETRWNSGELRAGLHADGSVVVELKPPSLRQSNDETQTNGYELDLQLPQLDEPARIKSMIIYWQGAARGEWLLYKPESPEAASLWANETISVAPFERGTAHQKTLLLDHSYPERLYLAARGVSKDFQIDNIKVELEISNQNLNWQWVSVKPKSSETKEGASTWQYLSQGPLPIERAKVILPPGSAAELRIGFARNNNLNNWSQQSYSAFALQNKSELLRDDGIYTGMTRDQHWRVTGDLSLPETPSLQLGYRPEHLMFLTQGQAPYTLAAGLRDAARNDFPVFDVMQRLRDAKQDPLWFPPTGQLGERETASGNEALKPAPPDQSAQRRRWLLWGILALGAIAISFIAIKLMFTPHDHQP